MKSFDLFKDSRIKEKGYECPSTIIYGPRGSGKTFLCSDLIYKMREGFDSIYLFSNTAHLQKGVFDFIPSSNKIVGYDEDVLQSIVDKQKNQVMLSNSTGCDVKKVIIVLDDVISNNKIRASPILNDLYISGRHLRILPILLSQSMGGKSGIPIIIRDNSDMVFSFYPSTVYDKKLIYERYLSMKDKTSAEQLIEDLTHERFSVMAIMNNKICQSRDYVDYVHSYKASEIKPFKIGSSEGIDSIKKTKKIVRRKGVVVLDVNIKID